MTRNRGQDSLALMFSLPQTEFGRWIEDYLLDPGETFTDEEARETYGATAAVFARHTLDQIESGDIAFKSKNAKGILKCLLCSVAMMQCRSKSMRAEILAQRAIRAKPSTTEGQIDEQ